MLNGTKFIQKKRSNFETGKPAQNIILKIACFFQKTKIVFGGLDITMPFYLCGTILLSIHTLPQKPLSCFNFF